MIILVIIYSIIRIYIFLNCCNICILNILLFKYDNSNDYKIKKNYYIKIFLTEIIINSIIFINCIIMIFIFKKISRMQHHGSI